MKKTTILFLILIFSVYKSQCTISALTLGLLGKNKYDVKNILYSDKNVSDIKEDNLVFDEDFGYLPKKHKQSFLNFTKSADLYCFSDDTSRTSYLLKFIDDKVYKIYMYKEYPLKSYNIYQNNYDNLQIAVYDSYSNIDTGYHLYGKFLNEEQKIGESTYFSKENRIPKKNAIWKVDHVMLSKKNIYDYDYKNSVNTNNQIGFRVELEFTDLRNTVLDNRGY